MYIYISRNNTKVTGEVFYGIVDPRNKKQIHPFSSILPFIHEFEKRKDYHISDPIDPNSSINTLMTSSQMENNMNHYDERRLAKSRGYFNTTLILSISSTFSRFVLDEQSFLYQLK